MIELVLRVADIVGFVAAAVVVAVVGIVVAVRDQETGLLSKEAAEHHWSERHCRSMSYCCRSSYPARSYRCETVHMERVLRVEVDCQRKIL